MSKGRKDDIRSAASVETIPRDHRAPLPAFAASLPMLSFLFGGRTPAMVNLEEVPGHRCARLETAMSTQKSIEKGSACSVGSDGINGLGLVAQHARGLAGSARRRVSSRTADDIRVEENQNILATLFETVP